ncbi:uncharacterized protein LOC130994291 [Salvia miltiorrhiza]|uniref:uncharacterized protein LOC130994291 n=1 Tax=Salvia miltiorrhiza TaxID=226208 RepID=UPI0025ABAEB8|nr:uncharacterized protein LOC130994291 [Salvia miltiorrhiza]
MLFYLTTVGFAGFLMDDRPPTPSEGEMSFEVRAGYANWCQGDYLCRNTILMSLDERLYNVFKVHKTSKEVWETLDLKYQVDKTNTTKYVVAKWLDYKMVDSRPVMDQVEEFQTLSHEVQAEGMPLADALLVAIIIEKLPPSWKSFQNLLKHERSEMSVATLVSKLQMEDHVRSRDQKGKAPMDAKANLTEKGGPSN